MCRAREPKGGGVVQHLPLQGQRAEHAIEGADAIGDDDHPLSVRGAVVVSNLALVLLSEPRKVAAIEGMREGLLNQGNVHQSAQKLTLSSELGRRPCNVLMCRCEGLMIVAGIVLSSGGSPPPPLSFGAPAPKRSSRRPV